MLIGTSICLSLHHHKEFYLDKIFDYWAGLNIVF